MRKGLFLAVLILGVFGSTAFGATIYLKDGKVVKGEILFKGDDVVSVKSGHVPTSYRWDQIDRIEEDVDSVFVTDSGQIDLTQFENISASKAKSILTYLTLNGTRERFNQNVQAMLRQYPFERKEILENILDVDGLMAKLVPVYDRFFTEPELQQLISFYQSPLGVKLLNTAPDLLTETMQVSADFFKEKLSGNMKR